MYSYTIGTVLVLCVLMYKYSSPCTQYMVFLNQLVEVFHSLEVWRVDPFLLGELCIKLGCLHEAKAQLKHPNSMSCTLVKLPTEDESFILEFDRSQLLVCLAELERGLKCVELAKEDNTLDARPRSREGEGREVITELDVLHAELVYAITRVRLKLASTIPPPREYIPIIKLIIDLYYTSTT